MVQVMPTIEEEIKRSIEDLLTWDQRLESRDIRVEVEGGIAKLTGSVPTYADRRYAGMDALRVPGVVSVENKLEVELPAAAAMPVDADVESNIKTTLALSRNIPFSRIRVSVKNGIVTIEGSVDTYWQKAKVGELTAGITGVTGIRDELAIVPTETYEDEDIARSIISAIGRSTNVDVNALTVTVANGIVTLSGTVPDWMAHRTVKEIAQFTGGVTAVNSELAVKLPAARSK